MWIFWFSAVLFAENSRGDSIGPPPHNEHTFLQVHAVVRLQDANTSIADIAECKTWLLRIQEIPKSQQDALDEDSLVDVESVLSFRWSTKELRNNNTLIGETSVTSTFPLLPAPSDPSIDYQNQFRALWVELWEKDTSSNSATSLKRLARHFVEMPRTKAIYVTPLGERKPRKLVHELSIEAQSKLEHGQDRRGLELDDTMTSSWRPKMMYSLIFILICGALWSSPAPDLDNNDAQEILPQDDDESVYELQESEEESIKELDEQESSVEQEGSFGQEDNYDDHHIHDDTLAHQAAAAPSFRFYRGQSSQSSVDSEQEDGIELPPNMQRRVPIPMQGISFVAEMERMNQLDLSTPTKPNPNDLLAQQVATFAAGSETNARPLAFPVNTFRTSEQEKKRDAIRLEWARATLFEAAGSMPATATTEKGAEAAAAEQATDTSNQTSVRAEDPEKRVEDVAGQSGIHIPTRGTNEAKAAPSNGTENSSNLAAGEMPLCAAPSVQSPDHSKSSKPSSIREAFKITLPPLPQTQRGLTTKATENLSHELANEREANSAIPLDAADTSGRLSVSTLAETRPLSTSELSQQASRVNIAPPQATTSARRSNSSSQTGRPSTMEAEQTPYDDAGAGQQEHVAVTNSCLKSPDRLQHACDIALEDNLDSAEKKDILEDDLQARRCLDFEESKAEETSEQRGLKRDHSALKNSNDTSSSQLEVAPDGRRQANRVDSRKMSDPSYCGKQKTVGANEKRPFNNEMVSGAVPSEQDEVPASWPAAAKLAPVADAERLPEDPLFDDRTGNRDVSAKPNGHPTAGPAASATATASKDTPAPIPLSKKADSKCQAEPSTLAGERPRFKPFQEENDQGKTVDPTLLAEKLAVKDAPASRSQIPGDSLLQDASESPSMSLGKRSSSCGSADLQKGKGNEVDSVQGTRLQGLLSPGQKYQQIDGAKLGAKTQADPHMTQQTDGSFSTYCSTLPPDSVEKAKEDRDLESADPRIEEAPGLNHGKKSWADNGGLIQDPLVTLSAQFSNRRVTRSLLQKLDTAAADYEDKEKIDGDPRSRPSLKRAERKETEHAGQKRSEDTVAPGLPKNSDFSEADHDRRETDDDSVQVVESKSRPTRKFQDVFPDYVPSVSLKSAAEDLETPLWMHQSAESDQFLSRKKKAKDVPKQIRFASGSKGSSKPDRAVAQRRGSGASASDGRADFAAKGKASAKPAGSDMTAATTKRTSSGSRWKRGRSVLEKIGDAENNAEVRNSNASASPSKDSGICEVWSGNKKTPVESLSSGERNSALSAELDRESVEPEWRKLGDGVDAWEHKAKRQRVFGRTKPSPSGSN